MNELLPLRKNDAVSTETEQQRLRMLTTPLSLRGWPVWMVYLLALLGLIYILNPTAGWDFIPDFIPGIGNLDEGVAVMMLWYGLVEFFEGRHYRPATQEEAVEAEWEELAPETAETPEPSEMTE